MLNEDEIVLLEQSKLDQEELLDKHIKGVMFRSKARWTMEGERNTKYFFNLEKAKYNAKTCTSVFDSAGDLKTEEREILKIQHKFYADLYRADQKVSFQMDIEPPNKVDEDLIASQEAQITLDEVRESLKEMKNGSYPGSDGIPTEFYKCFWRYIKEDLYAAMKDSYTDKIMYKTARTGILNLIP